MTGASNKPFDYLACGLPLVVSDLPDWKQMYVEPGYALACNPEDVNSIADVLRWYLEHPLEMKAMGEKGRQRILNEWNYETQFDPVFKQLSRVN
jgi:glycosyltransferase involved in cell wall biosynthesis